ncbi:MAG: SCO family protein [Pseudomonadales bacterium]|nr:SCO family protein [Pseudomonadales bacterium]
MESENQTEKSHAIDIDIDSKNNNGNSNAGKLAVIGFVTMTILSVAVLFLFKNATLPTISPLPIIDSIGGEFELPSSLDRPIKLSDFKGKVVMINFGYTSCPDICPMVLTRIAKVTKALKERRGFDTTKLQTLFITTDPERDDAEHLLQYLSHFHPDFIGLTGTTDAIKQVAKQYGVYYKKESPPHLLNSPMSDDPSPQNTDTYEVAHTDKIFLLDKLGRLRKLYSEEDSIDDLFNDIRGLVAERHKSLEH